VIIDLGSFDVANALALRADGTIAAAGCHVVDKISSFALLQYSPRGLPDPAFHAGKALFTSFGGQSCANGVAFSGADRLVAVGSASGSGTESFACLRVPSRLHLYRIPI
jgi:hypothetical protein